MNDPEGTVGQAGWYRPGARERHCFRDDRSLCDEYGLMAGARYWLDPADELTPDDCRECRRLLREEGTSEPIQTRAY